MKVRGIWLGGKTWMYRVVITQTDAGGGTVRCEIQPGYGNEFVIQSLAVGTDDYAGGRTVTVQINDNEASVNPLLRLFRNASVDNNFISIPQLATSGTNNQVDLSNIYTTIVTGRQDLRIQADSLAQNETLTIAVRLRLRDGELPTVTNTAVGGTISESETYNTTQYNP